jgi:hypothetical protein
MAIPEEAILEIRGRNIVAHTGLMHDDNDKEVEMERDVRRIRMIRTLLAGMILKHVGYEGALTGWDRDEDRWPLKAEWFPATESANSAARQTYHANAELDDESEESST